MHILLLGNGFDLYYKLPTKYNNFLNTVEFLLNNYNPDLKTIGDVFCSEILHERDNFIRESYQEYKNAYDNVKFDNEKITELLNLMGNNIWFKYFVSSFNKDIGWIDFEKEISLVIEVFREFLSGVSITYQKSFEKTVENYIVSFFDFFSTQIKSNNLMSAMMRKIENEYVLEYPANSGLKSVDKEKIVKELADSLEELAKGLRLYLQCFVENALDAIKNNAYIEKFDALSGITHIVTLNYTNTYEKFYNDENVFHVHGITDGNIVLGVNPDEYDELGTVDTSFIAFKKYFQRVMYETDFAYSKWITEFHEDAKPYTVTVMGHSLDVTDKDIIQDLFALADEIIVLYHSEIAKASYISNLVKIYGRSRFEMLRSEQKLTFVSLDSDLTWIPKKREEEENRKAFIETFLDEN